MDSQSARDVTVQLLNADGEVTDALGAARWWAAQREAAPCLARVNGAKPRFDQSLVARLRSLRIAAERILFTTGSIDGDRVKAVDLQTLNDTLGLGRLELRGAAIELTTSPVRMAAGDGGVPLDGAAPVLAPLAYAVAMVASSRDRDRLRRCAENSCSAYFWDGTKNRSRRWCSLRCMERERAPRRRLRR